MSTKPDPRPLIFSVSFSEQVFNFVKESILKGVYKPGQKLNEIELSQTLGVSRSPIREALQRLDNEGLVKLQPRKGAVVHCPSTREIEELFELREALEGMAVRLAAARGEEGEIRSLTDFLEETKRAIAKDMYSFYPWDLDFHFQMARCARNGKLEESIKKLNSQLTLARYLSGREMGRASEALMEHMQIVEAVKERDARKAKKRMITHLNNSRKNMMEIFSRAREFHVE